MVITALNSKSDTSKVPRWYVAMMAGQSWGIPPWEVTGEKVTGWTRQKWLFRYAWVSEQRGKAKK